MNFIQLDKRAAQKISESDDDDAATRRQTQPTKQLAVSGRRLGLTLNFIDEKTGAVVQEIDPTCTFRDKIAIGDRIISIDGKKISIASALKIGDDRERIFGIVSETAEDQKPDGILLQQKPASGVKHNNSLDDKRNDNEAGKEKPAAEPTKAHANVEQPASAVKPKNSLAGKRKDNKADGEKPVASKTNEPAKRTWRCDVCLEKEFDDYDKAAAHEKACTKKKVPVDKIGPNDVLFGRGGAPNNNPGNKKFLQMVESQKSRYNNAKRSEKRSISIEVVKEWRALGGRFLKQDNVFKSWYEVDVERAREKTLCCLREKGTPVCTKKHQQEEPLDDEVSV